MSSERTTYMQYIEAIGRTVGHRASAAKARKACPAEFAAWREAFMGEYGYDPAI